jgi:hypothetical protein
MGIMRRWHDEGESPPGKISASLIFKRIPLPADTKLEDVAADLASSPLPWEILCIKGSGHVCSSSLGSALSSKAFRAAVFALRGSRDMFILLLDVSSKKD